MAQDWTADVKKYVSSADDGAIKGIIKHCGIALKNKDSSFVSCTDKSERDRVRDSFLKKKLGLQESDGDLDKAVKDMSFPSAPESHVGCGFSDDVSEDFRRS